MIGINVPTATAPAATRPFAVAVTVRVLTEAVIAKQRASCCFLGVRGVLVGLFGALPPEFPPPAT